MAIVSVCLGLRWSELARLQWQDIDWLGGELTLRRALVMQICQTAVARCSTAGSAESAQRAERVYSGNRLDVRLTRSEWKEATLVHLLGTPLSVQQRAMGHGDIRVTMNANGDPVNNALKDASSKIAGRAISRLLTKSVS
jgi:integrase